MSASLYQININGSARRDRLHSQVSGIIIQHLQILEETLHASERQRDHDLKQQETILATAAAEHAAQERQGRLEELDGVSYPSCLCTSWTCFPEVC